MRVPYRLDTISLPLILAFALIPPNLISPAPLSGQTLFTVNTLDDVDDGVCDAGHCSLREAISAANHAVDGGIIHFSIPGPGPHTTQPLTPLPALEGGIIIDGTSEPDFATTPVIEVDGSLAGEAHGFNIVGSENLIRALVINRFAWNGISVNTDCTFNIIEGNFIGTDVTGTMALGNGNAGVLIGQASDNTVGGTIQGARNLISGNVEGVTIVDETATGNLVAGNYIGTDVTGALAIPNETGVLLLAPNNTIGGTAAGSGNLISGNTNQGINLGSPNATGNLIAGNSIGVDATGTMPLGNDIGVRVDNVADNIIGGTSEGAGNVVSGNPGGNMVVYGAAATGNLIQGNYIGTDVSGTVAVGGGRALQLIDAPGNTIGGAESGAGNLIAGNGNGILIDGLNASGNVIQGNSIGVDAGGSTSLENGGAGVRLSNGAAGNTIGGTTPNAGNIIANSRWMGVILFADAGTGNRIQSNSIYDNSALGIELGRNGVTPNDDGDGDTGPNNVQNYPVLTSVASNTAAAIQATLNSAPSSPFTVEFFSNPACDDSGFGQGHTPLGTAVLTTDASGNGTVAASFSGVDGGVFTATATDADGNTSEFSACNEVTTLTLSSSPSSHTVTPGQSATYGITVTAQGGTFEETVDLACSGGPSQTTCTLADNELDLSSGQASTNLTLTTVAPSALPPMAPGEVSPGSGGNPWVWGCILPLLMVALLGVGVRGGGVESGEMGHGGIAGVGFGSLVGLMGILLLLQVACGDGGSSPPTGGTPPGTYEVTVSATWESIETTTTVSLLVQ